VIHPLSREYLKASKPLELVSRVAPSVMLPMLEKIVAYSPPFVYSHVTGIKSPTGVEAEGWLITVGGTPKELLAHSPEFTYQRLLEAAKIAERLGAQLMGLGAFTKVVGDAGVTVAKRASIPITTGNSYSASGAVGRRGRGRDRGPARAIRRVAHRGGRVRCALGRRPPRSRAGDRSAPARTRRRPDPGALGDVRSRPPSLDRARGALARRRVERGRAPRDAAARRDDCAGHPAARFHDLRHTNSTLLLRSGVPLHHVQRIMRHRDVRLTTETYGHLVADDLRDAVEQIAPVRGPHGGPLSNRLLPALRAANDEGRDPTVSRTSRGLLSRGDRI
jgi:hypothetical protein